MKLGCSQKSAAQFLFPKEGSKSKCFEDLASLLLTGAIQENALLSDQKLDLQAEHAEF